MFAISKALKKLGNRQIKFAPTKTFIITRSKKGKVLVRGETSYNSNTGQTKLTLQNKSPRQIRPEEIPKGIIPPMPAKASDVKKLLEKHFGPQWNKRDDLDLYKMDLLGEIIAEPEEPENPDEPMDDEELHVQSFLVVRGFI